jgi:hypothetical protein
MATAASGETFALEKSYFLWKSVQSVVHFICSACWNKIVIAEGCSNQHFLGGEPGRLGVGQIVAPPKRPLLKKKLIFNVSSGITLTPPCGGRLIARTGF